jgi:hypothetical protein
LKPWRRDALFSQQGAAVFPKWPEGRALIIDKPSVATFRDGFAKLLKMISFRHQLQSIAFTDFPFTSTAMANKVDALRQAAFDTGLAWT